MVSSKKQTIEDYAPYGFGLIASRWRNFLTIYLCISLLIEIINNRANRPLATFSLIGLIVSSKGFRKQFRKISYQLVHFIAYKLRGFKE